MRQPDSRIDYDEAARAYALHRDVHPGVVEELLAGAGLGAGSRVLDVGCGTGNYARALQQASGCTMFGIEPSQQMRARAEQSAQWDALLTGSAVHLPLPDNSIDLIYSTDVIHHVPDRHRFFHEAARVLAPGGLLATVTDSHEDIRQRRPLSSHFPETVEIELQRYPAMPVLQSEMAAAGFRDMRVARVWLDYALREAQAYRDKAFSSLLLIDEEAFQRGLGRLERELVYGPIPCISLYSILWGESTQR